MIKILEANITSKVVDFLKEHLKNITYFEQANQMIYDSFGIVHFFNTIEELNDLKHNLFLIVILSKNLTD